MSASYIPATMKSRQTPFSARSQIGFTALELMLVVTIAAIILGIAVPSFRSFAMNNRMTSAANDLLAAVHTARTEAIKRHATTIVCFSTTPSADLPACDGTGAEGWVVFVDDLDPTTPEATDGNVVVDAGEEVLVRHDALTQIAVRSQPAGNAGYAAFSPSGFKREISAVGTDIEDAVLCDSRGNIALYGDANSAARGFTISITGRPAITRVVGDITALGGCP
jgi:type IV fimbrial biogenesis protein FimT